MDPHLLQDLLQVRVGLLGGELQLHDKSVYLIDDQDGPDVLQPRLTEHHLGLHTTQTLDSFNQFGNTIVQLLHHNTPTMSF